ncbi:MAG: hypothetical protein JJ841_004000 [Prochlorococcus marinus CUG1432]|uniref:hypothetical protein n=1 Tax=Prochlorococcus marinus TaxID=1219 RepID=UPI001AD97D1E|nr:hypothetical protein [Prochlorococcus marinus]MBO8230550.1 phytanoyl-CoA dioxygenase family protein [Prochlorococcus marinus XMU1404]MCR8545117.1 hypothetical protein [Prochlorococcus marinus CUG1432]
MSENLSLLYLFYDLKAKIIFKFKKFELFKTKTKETKEFKKYGFTVFTNRIIRKECNSILKKIKSLDDPWDSTNKFKDSASEIFKTQLISIFKNGIDEFIKSVFDSDYYIFYHSLYKSERLTKEKSPQGSQLWHADGGPGNCINLMICHSHIDESNGSMKIIEWEESKNLLVKLHYDYKNLVRNTLSINDFKNNRIFSREIKCSLLKKYIEEKSIKYFQPESKNSGAIFAFRNNCVHAGGFTEFGSERIVSIMHIYPSINRSSLDEKFNKLHLKTKPYPLFQDLPK